MNSKVKLSLRAFHMGAGNKGKGGKAYKSSKGEGAAANRTLVLKDESQAYARMKHNFGCGRIEVIVDDGTTIPAMLRGKKANYAVGSTILISFRETGEKVADVIHLYKDFEVRELADKKVIPSDFISQDEATQPGHEGFDFKKQKDMPIASTTKEVVENNSVVYNDPLKDMEDGEDEPAISSPNKPATASAAAPKVSSILDSFADKKSYTADEL